jgi:hypothetical protein
MHMSTATTASQRSSPRINGSVSSVCRKSHTSALRFGQQHFDQLRTSRSLQQRSCCRSGAAKLTGNNFFQGGQP